MTYDKNFITKIILTNDRVATSNEEFDGSWVEVWFCHSSQKGKKNSIPLFNKDRGSSSSPIDPQKIIHANMRVKWGKKLK